jgi:methylmalonyl-CoA/ethylmalonyl-CoA epimerase
MRTRDRREGDFEYRLSRAMEDGREMIRLHHVGILTADIGKAAQDYTVGLGYTFCSEVIHDPVQTAYVQFLQMAPGEPLVELVAPDGPTSKLTRSLKKPGRLHHLCYATEDIAERCRQLRSQCMFLVSHPVPAVAFLGRRIAWLMDRDGLLIELVEQEAAALSPLDLIAGIQKEK